MEELKMLMHVLHLLALFTGVMCGSYLFGIHLHDRKNKF